MWDVALAWPEKQCIIARPGSEPGPPVAEHVHLTAKPRGRPPSNFLIDKNTRRSFCSIEATLDGLLDGSWMGAGHQEDQALIRSFEFLALPLILQRGEGGWKLS